MDRHLFLFGGGPPFTPLLARNFTVEAKRRQGPVVILFVERKGWEAYMPIYTGQLEQNGFDFFHYLPLPSTPIQKVLESLQHCSGIIIGGGDTKLYADYIVDSDIAMPIQQCYQEGIPVAGFSAGALISMDRCILSPKDNEQEKYIERNGLALLNNTIIAVHFSEWNDLDHLKEAISIHPNKINYGIDEQTGIHFHNEIITGMEGKGIYSLKNNILDRLH